MINLTLIEVYKIFWLQLFLPLVAGYLIVEIIYHTFTNALRGRSI